MSDLFNGLMELSESASVINQEGVAGLGNGISSQIRLMKPYDKIEYRNYIVERKPNDHKYIYEIKKGDKVCKYHTPLSVLEVVSGFKEFGA